jgi:ssDNA-binding Zn-finger/Zn-ribbon topoisomerase 1
MIVLCPKCGSTRLMKIIHKHKGEQTVKLRCPKCRYTLTDEDIERRRPK